MNFTNFKLAVALRFKEMSQYDLFVVGLDKDELWNIYLEAFPEGSNLMFRKRREYDCSCCKQFIRAVGNVVAIINGEMVSIWDLNIPNEPEFNTVAKALSTFVKSHEIENIFRTSERAAGVDKNFQQVVDQVLTWEHFFVHIPSECILHKGRIGSVLGDMKASHDVLLRGLNEISSEAIDTVLELIAQNSIYRGEEHKSAVEVFKKLKFEWFNYSDNDNLFVWEKVVKTHVSISRIRNSAIGTLLINLSKGMDIDEAVAKYEKVVAPENYKRPTALVTPAMVEKAKKTVEELGLTSALQRRYATIRDLNVNNVFFFGKRTPKTAETSVFNEVATSTSAKKFDKVNSIPIEQFINDVLPHCASLEVYLENKHAANMVSLIAPVDPTCKPLFKWPNMFSWSYQGDFADSIKERVRKAGGNVEGDLCCRLSWANINDLDLHMIEPDGFHIYFGNKGISSSGGRLDVDMNASNVVEDPVENIYYRYKQSMKEGVYELYVHQYNERQTDSSGFEVEIDFMGTVYSFAYAGRMTQSKKILVAKFRYSKADGISFIESLPMSHSSKKVWGLDTQNFHNVSTVIPSPNFWGGYAVGNKHYFFMLEGCIPENPARGFYNEFLREDLNQHRKVLEMVGDKVRVSDSLDQLNGVGFSSTQKNELLVRVTGAMTRILKILF